MDKLLIAGVVGLAMLATLVDFAGRFLSMLSDGLLTFGMVAIVISLQRFHSRRYGALKDELARRKVGA
jgi:hypothetical protein